MESLLCDEVWVDEENRGRSNEEDGVVVQNYKQEDCEEAFGILVEKESRYMPEPGYANYVKLNRFIDNARFKAVHWLIRCRRRLNISFGSVFDAVNYLDRFISLKKCQEWKDWMMFELLSVACVSVSTKFNETHPPSLHEIQMEGIENLFGSDLIQRMELTLLEGLGWQLSSTTPYSYLHLLTSSFQFKETLAEEEFTSHVTDMLLGALLDPKFLEFRPCVVAETALKCSVEEFLPSVMNNSCFNYFIHLIPQDHKNDLRKCEMMMEKGVIQNVRRSCGRLYCPSSPVTVLTTKQRDFQLLDCSLFINMQTFNINNNVGSSIRKRKREPRDDDDDSAI